MQQCGSEGVFISIVNNVDVGVYHVPQQAGCGREVVFISTVNSVEVRVYLCLQVNSVDVRVCSFPLPVVLA
jgi:hypothetical protein